MRVPPEPPALWRFVAPALMVPLALALTVVWVQSEYARWEALRAAAQQSYQRRSEMVDLLSIMRSAETSQRGYTISGDELLRARYVEAERATRHRLRDLPAMFHDDAMRGQLGNLARTADAKFAEMDEVIHLYDRRGAAAAQRRISDGEGQRLMVRFERVAGDIIRHEIRTGEQRVAAFQARTAAIERMMWLIVALVSVALGMVLLLLWRQRRAKFDATLAGFEAAERNSTILNATADPIIIINPSGTIETINASVTRLLGYEPDDIVRRDISMLSDIAPGTGSFYERIGLVYHQLPRSFLHEQPFRHRLGEVIPFDVALGVMRLPDGDHIVASLRDTSDRRRLDRLREELISTVSHELRTPLTSVIGAIALLRDGESASLSDDARELIRIAESNGQRLIRLINDMLDIDRIDAGKFRMVSAPVDLREVVRGACNDHAVLAWSHEVALDCQLPEEPLVVQGDEARLMQVIVNLVANALKFSPVGSRVKVSARRDVDDKIIVEVDDRGPGIAAEFRSRIFQRFERAAGSEGSAGTGLGLAIARDIVARHGGEIWYEDRPLGGTRFSIALPAAIASQSDQVAMGRRALVCARDPQLGADLQALMAAEGYSSHVVTSAQAAHDALTEDDYQLLLLDMALDDPDAFAMARGVRRVVSPDALSILVVSPGARGGSGEHFSLDLVDWMDKPVDGDRLRAAIIASIDRDGDAVPKVLHLDDDQDTLDVTARALAGVAHILKARSLVEARALLSRETPDLVILDFHLETGTGADLLPELLDEHGIAIPTIIYSAHDVRVDTHALTNAVVIKSRHSAADLKATIRQVLALRHQSEGGRP